MPIRKLICQWVEHYIRELLGYVPPFIRFLKLDTDASDEGGPPEGLMSDIHASAEYRSNLVSVMAKRAVETAG